MKSKEHIYKGNKIIEYEDGVALATALDEDGEVIAKGFDTLKDAKVWLDYNGYSIDD